MLLLLLVAHIESNFDAGRQADVLELQPGEATATSSVAKSRGGWMITMVKTTMTLPTMMTVIDGVMTTVQ